MDSRSSIGLGTTNVLPHLSKDLRITHRFTYPTGFEITYGFQYPKQILKSNMDSHTPTGLEITHGFQLPKQISEPSPSIEPVYDFEWLRFRVISYKYAPSLTECFKTD
jgi:hypothetical protein